MLRLSKNLVLTSPNQVTPRAEIREVQRILGVNIDGVYGPVTASAVKNWKYRYGFHEKFVTTSFTIAESQWMFASKSKTQAMKIRAASRAVTRPKSVGFEAMEEMRRWANAGYVETSRNVVPQLQALAKSLGLSAPYQAMGWSWCALATGLSGLKVGSKSAKALFAGSFNQHLPLYVPAIYGHALAGRFGLKLVSREQAMPGDLVVFNWDGGVPDHIGRLVQKKDANTFLSVEGNTSVGTTGSQSNGDGVYQRVRYYNTVSGFIREDS